jgi:hypothetical protein
MSDAPPTDLLGRPIPETERRLLDLYRGLLALLERDLAPCAEANVREAAAALWQAVNDLALSDERPDL